MALKDQISQSDSNEQSQFDEAMKRADDLLVASLKKQDRRRGRRRMIGFLAGGIMVAAICVVVVMLLAEPKDSPTAAPATPAVVDAQKSEEVSQEGWQLFTARQPQLAVVKFEQAVELNPKNSAAWNGLGWADFNIGKRDQASAAFEKVLEMDPAHPAALNGIGQIALMNRDYPKAEKYFLKAAGQAPAAWYGLTRLYLLQGKFEDAQPWAQKLVDSGQADEVAKQMLQAAKDKQLNPALRMSIEPPPAPATKPAA
jgi:Flp pilus assembly protein TadD